jgi:hypothetical protein
MLMAGARQHPRRHRLPEDPDGQLPADRGAAVLGRLALQELVGERRRCWTQPRDLGVIAGCTSAGMGRFVSNLPEPNDGTVAVDETRISGMKEHLVLPVTHTGMMLSSEVADRTARFLHGGVFVQGVPPA